MTDDRLRATARAWRTSGDPAEEARVLQERVRAGGLTAPRLELAARCGHEAASKALEQVPLAGTLAELFAGLDPALRRQAILAGTVSAAEAAYGLWLARDLGARLARPLMTRFGALRAKAWLLCPCVWHERAAQEVSPEVDDPPALSVAAELLPQAELLEHVRRGVVEWALSSDRSGLHVKVVQSDAPTAPRTITELPILAPASWSEVAPLVRDLAEGRTLTLADAAGCTLFVTRETDGFKCVLWDEARGHQSNLVRPEGRDENERQLVPIALAIRAARCFCEDGVLDPGLVWKPTTEPRAW